MGRSRRRADNSFRRAGTPAPSPSPPFTERWWGKTLLLLLSVLLLTFSFAPFDQFYLAWVGLVPWLVVVSRSRTAWRAFGWGWVGALLFFTANMWWLAYVTGPGLVALMAILALYWAAPGVVMWGAGLFRLDDGGLKVEGDETQPPAPRRLPAILHPLSSTLAVPGIATIWAGFEWLRGTWPWGGLPWLYLGHTQTPALHLCQVADFAGAVGVSFWVVLVNAWVTLFVLNRLSVRGLVPAGVTVVLVLAAVLGYGAYRIGQTPRFVTPGPTVLVVQPNYKQSNTGQKGAPLEDIIDFHVRRTRSALARHPGVDLVVWSETMMPALNAEARKGYNDVGYGSLAGAAHETLKDMAFDYKAAFLVGGSYLGEFVSDPTVSGPGQPTDSRNSAYYYERSGALSDLRYDKVHLVPFGEYIPFKETLPPLYRLLISFGPPDMERYQLVRGEQVVRFPLPPKGEGDGVRPWRFVTPICFEDIVGPRVAEMFQDPGDPSGGAKSADLLVNITNDGWFRANEMPQHLQAATFRSIENRVPTARSVNTGVSGFIDSTGWIDPATVVPAGKEGVSVATVMLDSRTTFFTRYGEVFARVCGGVTALIGLAVVVRWWLARRKRGRSGEVA
jgi:apolipoprotein N-acyltransferase